MREDSWLEDPSKASQPPAAQKRMSANKLTADLLLELPKVFPNIRIWRNNRIDAMAKGREGKMRRVKAGINGQGDISGIAGPLGRRIELEVKVGRDIMSDNQRAFSSMIHSLGGIYIVCRSLQQAIESLGQALYPDTWNI